jgi:hypothetical protein
MRVRVCVPACACACARACAGHALSRGRAQAARAALANTIDLANVKRVQIKHVGAIPTLEKEIQSHLTAGVMTDEYSHRLRVAKPRLYGLRSAVCAL